MHFILSGFTQIVMNVTKTVTTATQMATAPTPKDRSTVRVIQDTLVTESRVNSRDERQTDTEEIFKTPRDKTVQSDFSGS